jgi:hypothetical protein
VEALAPRSLAQPFGQEELINHVLAPAPECNRRYAAPFAWNWMGDKMRELLRLANGRYSGEGTSATGLEQLFVRPNY